MNHLSSLFANKKNNILSVYFTAGYPALDDTLKIITELEKNGADLVEIGIPFSDPVADGPVIQESSRIALKNGMSLKVLFDQLQEVRRTVTIPLVLMGYINPVYQMGMENFLKKCSETGIDGVIIPDLPVEEYTQYYQDMFKRYNIHFICLITPQSPDERIRYIDSISEGFIYMVSSASTTGGIDSFNSKQLEYFERVKNLNLRAPYLVGFGISNSLTFNTACEYSNGAIIGSAVIKALDGPGDIGEKIAEFISSLKRL